MKQEAHARRNRSSASLPLGNGRTGINAWADEPGALGFYISHTDAFDEWNRLVKIGAVGIWFLGNESQPMQGAWRPERGEMEFRGDAKDPTVVLWVDSEQDVVFAEIASSQPTDVKVTISGIRGDPRELLPGEGHCIENGKDATTPICLSPDHFKRIDESTILWWHENQTSIVVDTLRHHGMQHYVDQAVDPLLHRIFGARLTVSPAPERCAGQTFHWSQVNRMTLAFSVVVGQPTDGACWVDEATEFSLPEADASRRSTSEYWTAFDSRIFIQAEGSEVARSASRAWRTQRLLTAHSDRGEFPVKFNGSIFTADWGIENEDYDADYRRWGEAYWWQNTRLIYWPLLSSGDAHRLRVLFRYYERALPFARERCRIHFGIEGAFFPESMYPWGAYLNRHFGWDREGRPGSWIENIYVRKHWTSGLELSFLHLEYFAFAEDQAFFVNSSLPVIRDVLVFFLRYFEEASKPFSTRNAQCIEMWTNTLDPTPDLAGLHAVLRRLLALPARLTTGEDRRMWSRFQESLPELALSEAPGKILAARAVEGSPQNMENPELYAVFPFRLITHLGHQQETGIRTFRERANRDNFGWHQTIQQAALLGLSEEAASALADFLKSDVQERFPGFWGPHHDWIPDMDHGANIQMGLQSMLLQWEGDEIFVLPAWPDEWDVSFRLAAPQGTIVEVDFSQGSLQRVTTSPPERLSCIRSSKRRADSSAFQKKLS